MIGKDAYLREKKKRITSFFLSFSVSLSLALILCFILYSNQLVCVAFVDIKKTTYSSSDFCLELTLD